jgi:hypothetical protein
MESWADTRPRPRAPRGAFELSCLLSFAGFISVFQPLLRRTTHRALAHFLAETHLFLLSWVSEQVRRLVADGKRPDAVRGPAPGAQNVDRRMGRGGEVIAARPTNEAEGWFSNRPVPSRLESRRSGRARAVFNRRFLIELSSCLGSDRVVSSRCSPVPRCFHRISPTPQPRRAFTLIELLVVGGVERIERRRTPLPGHEDGHSRRDD